MGFGPYPKNRKIIDNKWLFRIKELVNGSLENLKSILVAKGYLQVVGYEFVKTISHVVIRKLVGFINKDHLEYVYHLNKSLYGLNKALQAWFDTLSQDLTQLGFTQARFDDFLFFLVCATYRS